MMTEFEQMTKLFDRIGVSYATMRNMGDDSSLTVDPTQDAIVAGGTSFEFDKVGKFRGHKDFENESWAKRLTDG